MNINIIDTIIILIILLGGIVGFKEGAIKKLTSIVGLLLVVILSFALKNKISFTFYENLPFFDLWGIFKGIQSLNIILYEMLSFLIIASVLSIIYHIILGITGVIEKILKTTVILSIPSKILGFFVGLIENYIWVYLILFVITLPFFNIREIQNSKYAMKILNDTPILSKYTEKTMDIYNDIYEVVDNSKDKSKEKINEEAMDVMLKYKILTVSSADKLIERQKVDVTSTSFIDKYR